MAVSDINIVIEIQHYIVQHGGYYPFWYMGLAEHPEKKLKDHGVNLVLDHFKYLTATCLEDANAVKEYFVKRLGTDGDPRDGTDPKALSVYVYKKSISTRP